VQTIPNLFLVIDSSDSSHVQTVTNKYVVIDSSATYRLNKTDLGAYEKEQMGCLQAHKV
jgi:translation elongation factor EF-4